MSSNTSSWFYERVEKLLQRLRNIQAKQLKLEKLLAFHGLDSKGNRIEEPDEDYPLYGPN